VKNTLIWEFRKAKEKWDEVEEAIYFIERKKQDDIDFSPNILEQIPFIYLPFSSMSLF
jgi:hypothetical protein